MPECLIGAGDAEGAVPVHALAPGNVDAFLADRADIAGFVRAAGFKAAGGALLGVPGGTGMGCYLFGLGRDEDRAVLLPGRLGAALPAGDYTLGDGFSASGEATLAFALGAYRFSRYRERERGPRLVLPAGDDTARVIRIADGVYLARDLINTPANAMGPAELALAAEDLAARHGASITVTQGDALAEGFPLIHAVGAAATPARAPRLIDLTWGDPAAPKVTLVGKGVCFDTGGLDIKPSSGMLLMKKDMGGAANVLGLAHMIMDGGLGVRLRVLIPAVENAISGAAFRPGDVFRSRLGLTVEIGNTDAEGRLVLADALALAAEESPALIVDMATLTGAARVALGPGIVPFFTRDDGLAGALAAKGDALADPVWRLPLWRPYLSMLDSRIADINNAGSAPFAGAITAALFLSRFVPETQPWIHADIYGWNPKDAPGRPEGGEAQAIRALHALLESRYAA
ncbi:MAG: leucyl aminopeptidase family protein [Rhizobiales bacterium]|nr:leucyl aminopeptidase family protein [Hyphomicrobiales bacterium]